MEVRLNKCYAEAMIQFLYLTYSIRGRALKWKDLPEFFKSVRSDSHEIVLVQLKLCT